MSETPASHPDAEPPEPGVPGPPAPPSPPEPPAVPKPPGGELMKITDPERMKALAHPARMAVFDFLATRRVQGFEGATATEIAEVAGMTPSAMSYHLRTLARAGFIEEAPSRGDARERLWRMTIESFSIAAEPDAPESHRVIERTMGEAFREQQERNFSRWLDQRSAHPRLREASFTQQGHIRLTVEEAEEFARRYMELEQEYVDLTKKRSEQGVDPEDGTVVWNVLFRFFPKV
ncbi:helix-turn-helix domain-containing protein [Glycomyces sp. TRM65418]|uniref:ArsR/SmtB family transcription factor n=1 Tax=Glycomyces sp. TRM65418 TaxID=2867006 RepID=UPI001CE67B7D|nr:helix-turn-helix domain-containing protein [Glycomyces sp. TRM65418]MCC3764024.1 helix-turn-helix domain-containing protein [Glycomyces sp. TRM65418]QZD53715.1 helix-turn-helix domain-containing protein [Glycomyces sp. TRM65418]